MRYAFPCDIVRDEEEEMATGREAYVVTFPDVPEAITGGWTWEVALEMAEDALSLALSFYVDERQDIPTPSDAANEQVVIPVRPITAAKLVIYAAMRKQGATEVALAEKLGITETAVRKLCDPGYSSHISQIERALRVLGRSLVIEDTPKSQARSELVAAR